ncbi:MAG: cytochrome c3 family protein [Desulfosudaceae bacterium]
MIKENVKLAYGLAAVLLIVGIICYAAGSGSRPEEPVRIVFSGIAGDVLFDHLGHLDYEGDCYSCHHHGDGSPFMACSECHQADDPETVPAVCDDCHPLSWEPYIHDEHHRLLRDEPGSWTCQDCHSIPEGESIPYACGDCHDPYDEYFVEIAEEIQMKYEKSEDAFHDQCIGCHQDYGAGPVECSMCHAQ